MKSPSNFLFPRTLISYLLYFNPTKKKIYTLDFKNHTPFCVYKNVITLINALFSKVKN